MGAEQLRRQAREQEEETQQTQFELERQEKLKTHPTTARKDVAGDPPW